MQNKTVVLVAGIVAIALILGGVVGGIAGITYQNNKIQSLPACDYSINIETPQSAGGYYIGEASDHKPACILYTYERK